MDGFDGAARAVSDMQSMRMGRAAEKKYLDFMTALLELMLIAMCINAKSKGFK